MAKEVSKTISKGLHKNGASIREMLLKSNAVNQTYSELQNKQRNEAIALLFSSEKALAILHDQMAANHPQPHMLVD
jgi:hypothetical protein